MVVKISCAVAEILCAVAEISSVVAKISLYCNSPTQIFPTKTTSLVALILFRKYQRYLDILVKSFNLHEKNLH